MLLFIPTLLDQYTLHYYFIASFIPSYYCCFFSQQFSLHSWSITNYHFIASFISSYYCCFLYPLDQYTLHLTYFLASFIPSYYCCFLSQPSWINTLFIIIILLLVLFHLIIVAFYPNPLDQYTLHYYFIASFIPSYYCCFLFQPSWINTLFIIILLLVLFHLIIVAFYPNPLDQYTLHYYFIASFISSYYCCFLFQPSGSIHSSYNYFIASFIPSYYCCFLFQPSWSIYSSLLFYC